MASSAADAPSTASGPLQIGGGGWTERSRAAIEAWLEAERDQLVLWIPVAIGAGVAAWYALDTPRAWLGTMLGLGAVGLGALAIGRHGRALRAIGIAALAAAIGLALVWARAERVAAPVLDRPVIARFVARVDSVDPLPARELVRLEVTAQRTLSLPCTRPPCPPPAALPPHFRVNLDAKDLPAGLGRGAVIGLRARLMPSPSAASTARMSLTRRAKP